MSECRMSDTLRVSGKRDRDRERASTNRQKKRLGHPERGRGGGGVLREIDVQERLSS